MTIPAPVLFTAHAEAGGVGGLGLWKECCAWMLVWLWFVTLRLINNKKASAAYDIGLFRFQTAATDRKGVASTAARPTGTQVGNMLDKLVNH